MDKYWVKQKCNAWETDKTFFLYLSAKPAISVRNTSGWTDKCQVVVQPRILFTWHQRMWTRNLQDKERTISEQNICQSMANVCQLMATTHPVVALVQLSPFQVSCIHITLHQLYRPLLTTEHIYQMRNSQERHTEVHKQIRNFVLHKTFANAKMWQILYILWWFQKGDTRIGNAQI